jgi:hypothetical protein
VGVGLGEKAGSEDGREGGKRIGGRNLRREGGGGEQKWVNKG